MLYEEQNIDENDISLSDWWGGFTENYNSFVDNLNFLGNRNRSNFTLRDTSRSLGKFGNKSNSVLSGGLTWLETGDWKAGVVGGSTGYYTNEALQTAITAKIMGGHLKAGLARTSVGWLYGGAMYNMFYDIPAHADDSTWKPNGFLSDTPLFQLENYLVKKDKLAYKVYNDVQQQMLKDQFDYNNELLKKQWEDFKRKSDLSPSNTVLKGRVSKNVVNNEQKIIPSGNTTAQAANITELNKFKKDLNKLRKRPFEHNITPTIPAFDAKLRSNPNNNRNKV